MEVTSSDKVRSSEEDTEFGSDVSRRGERSLNLEVMMSSEKNSYRTSREKRSLHVGIISTQKSKVIEFGSEVTYTCVRRDNSTFFQ